MGFDRRRRSEDTFENKIPFILATHNHISSCNQKAERSRRIFWWRGFRLLADRNHIQQKKRKVKTLRLLFKGGRWDWLLRSLTPAPLNAFPLCSPQGHYHITAQEVAMQPFCLYHISLQINLPRYNKNKRCWLLNTFLLVLWVEDGIRTHDLRNHNPSL